MKIFILAIVFYIAQITNAKRGFIFTSPEALDIGTTQNVILEVIDVDGDCSASVKLLNRTTDDILTETESTVKHGVPAIIALNIPSKASLYNGRIKVSGTCADYNFEGIKEVQFRHKQEFVFIETDKPLYKPGQTVKFRVLVLTQYLKPLPENTIEKVWIENPKKIRVAQWLDIKSSNDFGMIQLSMDLSEESPVGSWLIHVSVKDMETLSYFSVEEYVLPKFELIITPPSYVLVNAEQITWNICAKYSYGKLVTGKLQILLSYESYHWDSVTTPRIKERAEIDGCFEYTANTTLLDFKNTYFRYRGIKLFVQIEEAGTGIKLNSTNVVRRESIPLHLSFDDNRINKHYFKSGIPYTGILKVKRPDDKPFTGSNIQLCSIINHKPYLKVWEASKENTFCRNFTSNEKGLIKFTIPPQSMTVDSITVKADTLDYEENYNEISLYPSKAELRLEKWFSRNGSFIQIQTSEKQLKCGETEDISVLFTTSNYNLSKLKFKYQIMSKGKIISHGEIEHAINYTVIKPDKETLIDDEIPSPPKYFIPSEEKKIGSIDENSLLIGNFETRLKDNVVLQYHEFKFKVDITPEMSPIARLLIYYIQEDGETVADSAAFHISDCLSHEVKLHYEETTVNPGSNVKLNIKAEPSSLCGIGAVDKSVYLLKSSNQLSIEKLTTYFESLDIKEWEGVPQLQNDYCSRADWNYGPTHRHYRADSADSLNAFENARILIITDYLVETRPCIHITQQYPIFYDSGIRGSPGNPGMYSSGDVDRLATPLSAGASVDLKDPIPSPPQSGQTGISSIRNYFPETWLWSMEKISETGELTKEFKTPDTITNWVTDAVCIGQTLGLGVSPSVTLTTFQPFFVSFTLPYSVIRSEIIPIPITVFNYLSECLPLQISLDVTEDIKVVENLVHHFVCVCGGKSVTRNFTIIPQTIGNINITVSGHTDYNKQLCNEGIADNVEYRDIVTRTLLVEAEGLPEENTITTLICPNGELLTSFELTVPSNVVPGSERAIFSITGDIMSQSINNIEHLVQMPTGCGEQNMVKLSPNIVILDYMKQTGSGTKELQDKALQHVQTGYQRQLNYRRTDCSYSAFGNSDDDGSMFLTAFVVRTFAQAKKFINIDEKDLQCSIDWILKHQKPNGCIHNRGKVLHQAMKGGLKDSRSDAPLTAYVLIALLETGYNQQDSIERFIQCINIDSNPSIYTLALAAYATSLIQHPLSSNYLQKLEEKAVVEGEVKYWKQGGETETKSVNVEISSYVLMAILGSNRSRKLIEVLPIIKQLVHQQNSYGGFISTQDTVVTIQALAMYGSIISKDKLDMEVTVDTDVLKQKFQLSPENKLLLQQLHIVTIPTVVDVLSMGSGCAILQASVRYNILPKEEAKIFDFTIDTEVGYQNDCKKAIIKTCMRYIPEGKSTNMAVLEIRMVSGFEPIKESLDVLINDILIDIKRYEIQGGKVNFYFDEMNNHEKCFEFAVEQTIKVENVQSAIAYLFDYYDREKYQSQTYEITGTCN